jgi:hypothetical protein
MVECWASAIGSCSSKASKEHIISGGLFIDTIVRVEGFSWCKDNPKEIGLDSLTAKILCKTHNETLSPVDDAGIGAFKAFRELRRIANVRKGLRPRSWPVIHHSINGIMLERWFLKTLINISLVDRKYPIGGISSKNAPTEDLVKIAFGLAPFLGRSGLYSVIYDGQRIDSSDVISFSPLIKDKSYIAGGKFSFRGFKFLLFLLPEGPPEQLTGIRFGEEDWGQAQLNYHNRSITEELQGHRLSQIVDIDWGISSS